MSAPSDEILAAIAKDLKAATWVFVSPDAHADVVIDLLEGIVENVGGVIEQIETAITTGEYTREFPDEPPR